MKLENENVLGVQTPPRKSYNPFESDDEDADAYTKSNINGYDIKSFETTADSLTFHLDTSDLSWEEAILGHSRVLSNSISADASNEEIPYQENSELFTDKTITECELPELEFSYKDNGFYSVKDIGIDEGVPTQDKIWIISQDSHNSKNDSDHVMSLTEDVTDKSRSDDDVKKDAFVQNQIKDSVNEGELVHEVSARPYSTEQCKTADFLKEDEDGLKHDSVKNEKDADSNRRSIDLFESDDIVSDLKDPYVDDKEEVDFCKAEKIGNEVVVEEEYCKHNVPIQHAEKPSTSPSIVHEVEAAMESNENQSEVAPDQPVVLPALQESVSNGVTNALSYNSKVESGSIILDFNAATTVSTDEKEEIPQEKEALEKPPETQTMSRDDGGAPGFSILDCATDKRVHGETSFSAAMPPPSSIIYMGPHANTGSISIRSESSTGSTRSFAFPVLQTEWNSSPVRMAKADQRHFRKQRGWVHFVCCKF